ncbi:MAG: pyrimidine dimer DNA glycosylase/endonuclease V [Candidatus Nanopelagicaceae bacterium]|jgi:hypothetical protein
MNIFFVHPDPREAARQLCDKHICKMILESVQMLSTAHPEGEAPYGCIKSHINHPCTKWARETYPNYDWLVDHLLEMCSEYTSRYGKVHKMEDAAKWLKDNQPSCIDRPAAPMTKPPQCMPDDCKCNDGFFWDAIEGYRKYYKQEKAYFAKWKNGNTPKWFVKG